MRRILIIGNCDNNKITEEMLIEYFKQKEIEEEKQRKLISICNLQLVNCSLEDERKKEEFFEKYNRYVIENQNKYVLINNKVKTYGKRKYK